MVVLLLQQNLLLFLEQTTITRSLHVLISRSAECLKFKWNFLRRLDFFFDFVKSLTVSSININLVVCGYQINNKTNAPTKFLLRMSVHMSVRIQKLVQKRRHGRS